MDNKSFLMIVLGSILVLIGFIILILFCFSGGFLIGAGLSITICNFFRLKLWFLLIIVNLIGAGIISMLLVQLEKQKDIFTILFRFGLIAGIIFGFILKFDII